MFMKVLILTILTSAVLCVDVADEGKKKTTTSTPKPTSISTTTSTTSTSDTPNTTPTTIPTTITPSTIQPTTVAPTVPTPTGTTTSPPPTPTPTPDSPWIVKDNTSGDVCMLAKADLRIDIPYKTNDSKSAVGKVFVPKNASVEGSCGDKMNSMKLSWDGNQMVIVFVANKTSKQYWVKTISASVPVTPKLFPNMSDTNTTVFELEHKGKNFVTPLNYSYLCSSELQLNMNVTKANSTARLSLNHLKFDAFHSSNKTEFSSAFECENDETPDLVPIAVGCAIATLIIVVLISYLVSRRRSQARGYLSM